MSDTESPLPEPDALDGAPHPRETAQLFGHAAAEAAFLDAFNAGKLHHAWLITGPRGVGKATLAWRLARFVLAQGSAAPETGGLLPAPPAPATLDIAPDHPVARRVAALSEPGLMLLRRPWDEKTKKLRAEITVEEARKVKRFFSLTATDRGRRVVIVDAADELNPSAANAILKLLEEPPEGAIWFIVAHQPARLLPTIRSRCRVLRLGPLGTDDLAQALAATGAGTPEDPVALSELAGGSVGAAIGLMNGGGLEIYRDLVTILAHAPRYDRAGAVKLAESAAGPANTARFALILDLVSVLLSRLARHGTGAALPEACSGEAEAFARLAPTPRASLAWAGLQQDLSDRGAHGRAVHLDPAALILDMIIRISDMAAREAA